MRIPVKLRSIAFDTGAVKPGTMSLQFFQDESVASPDAASDCSEPVIVQRLSNDFRTRHILLQELSLPVSAVIYNGVRGPFTNANKKPGDIDLLACEFDRPHQAVVVECKKVKIRFEGGAERINRLEALGGADSQARALFGLGFHRTYLGVVVVVDGRANADNNFLFRGVSEGGYRRILEFAEDVSLPQDVGILYAEIVQPVQRSVADAAVFSVAVAKEAVPRLQSERVTTLVHNFARRQRG
jgi:hypothetical protein